MSLAPRKGMSRPPMHRRCAAEGCDKQAYDDAEADPEERSGDLADGVQDRRDNSDDPPIAAEHPPTSQTSVFFDGRRQPPGRFEIEARDGGFRGGALGGPAASEAPRQLAEIRARRID